MVNTVCVGENMRERKRSLYSLPLDAYATSGHWTRPLQLSLVAIIFIGLDSIDTNKNSRYMTCIYVSIYLCAYV